MTQTQTEPTPNLLPTLLLVAVALLAGLALGRATPADQAADPHAPAECHECHAPHARPVPVPPPAPRCPHCPTPHPHRGGTGAAAAPTPTPAAGR